MKKKIRGFNRYKASIEREFNQQVDDYISEKSEWGEVFFALSFSDYHKLKLSQSDKEAIIDLILSSASRIKQALPEKGVLAWIYLNRLSESSIYMFDERKDYEAFFSDKQKIQDDDSFFIEEIKTEDLPLNLKSLADRKIKVDLFTSCLVKGKDTYRDEEQQVLEEYLYYLFIVGDFSKDWLN